MSAPSYKIEIESIDRIGWEHLTSQFDDASLYQTWAFGGSSSRTRSVSHIVIKRGEEIIGCCQLRIRRIPLLNIGIADINSGPLCQRKARLFEPKELFYLMRKIKEEYAIRRGYMLRIWAHATGEKKELLKRILETEGFRINKTERPYRTFRIDLSPSLLPPLSSHPRHWKNFA